MRAQGWVLLQNPLLGGVRGGFFNTKYMSQKRKIIPYNPELKELARDLRKNMTLSEVLLWNQLKQKNMMRYDFDRQRPIENYIVDFYCKELTLAIEIDGDTHIYRYEEDDIRQKTLENLGIRFLRFEDIEVKKNISNVLRVIEDWISKNQPTPEPPLRRGRLPLSWDKSSREGKLTGKDLIRENQPTPNPPSLRSGQALQGGEIFRKPFS